MEAIILVLFGLAIAYGVVSWYQQGTAVSDTHNAWLGERRAIQFEPVAAEWYGTYPRKYLLQGGIYGVVGVVDDTLTFVTRSKLNFAVPLSAIRWLGLRTITVPDGKSSNTVTALFIHAESNDGWSVYSLYSYASYQLAAYLSQHCNLRVFELGAGREDYGPTPATRMSQDIYGQWQHERRGELYLVPDWLVFSRYTMLRLEHIQRLGAYERGGVWNGLGSLSGDLLRIEYQEPGGKLQTIGFLVRNAGGWAEAIHKAGDRPIPIESGRKKKSA
jgi:hypothetical protein